MRSPTGAGQAALSNGSLCLARDIASTTDVEGRCPTTGGRHMDQRGCDSVLCSGGEPINTGNRAGAVDVSEMHKTK